MRDLEREYVGYIKRELSMLLDEAKAEISECYDNEGACSDSFELCADCIYNDFNAKLDYLLNMAEERGVRQEYLEEIDESYRR